MRKKKCEQEFWTINIGRKHLEMLETALTQLVDREPKWAVAVISFALANNMFTAARVASAIQEARTPKTEAMFP